MRWIGWLQNLVWRLILIYVGRQYLQFQGLFIQRGNRKHYSIINTLVHAIYFHNSFTVTATVALTLFPFPTLSAQPPRLTLLHSSIQQVQFPLSNWLDDEILIPHKLFWMFRSSPKNFAPERKGSQYSLTSQSMPFWDTWYSYKQVAPSSSLLHLQVFQLSFPSITFEATWQKREIVCPSCTIWSGEWSSISNKKLPVMHKDIIKSNFMFSIAFAWQFWWVCKWLCNQSLIFIDINVYCPK